MAKSSRSLFLCHALRDLRGSLRQLRLLLICLVVSIAVMSCIGSLVEGIKRGIDRDAKALLGGDVEIRQLYKPIDYAAQAYLQLNSLALSRTKDMRAMAQHKDRRTLVELKGVDAQYPLYGTLEFKDQREKKPLARIPHRPMWGAAVDQGFLNALNIGVGQRFTIGKAEFVVTALIANEPDRGVGNFALGPRVLVSRQAFDATGLITLGSMVNYRFRVKLPENTDLSQWKARLEQQFPSEYWTLRDWQGGAPGFNSLIDRLSLFFALTGITTLLVAGIGIGNAVSVYLWKKREIIATLKCTGATQTHILLVYLTQLLLVSLLAITLGLIAGALGEIILIHSLDDLLPAKGESGIFLKPLFLSGALGLVTTFLFSLIPLLSTSGIKPALLLRGFIETRVLLPRSASPWLILGFLTAILIILAIGFTGTVRIPLYFFGGTLFALILLLAIGQSIERFAAKRAHKGYRLTLSMALANLARPGASTTSMVIALGISISLLVALSLVSSNLQAQFEKGLPEKAPAFFLIDIQPSQREELMKQLHALPGIGRVDELPMVRGRIIKLNGTYPDINQIDERARWVLRGDRGLTVSAKPPENTTLVKGAWWPADYHGEPLVSFDASLARNLNLSIGDTITIAALDKEITARIHNLRDIQWGSLEMNFAIILSPGALDDLPATYLATVTLPESSEKPLQQLMANAFPTVSMVYVREVLVKAAGLLSSISHSVLLTASITVLCGMLVMVSAIHGSLQKRLFDTVILKVLGVTRGRILRIYLTEFALLAIAVALISVIIGSIAAWGIMQTMVFSQFNLMPGIIILTLAISLLLSICIALIAARATLNVRPLALLRNE